MDTEALRLILWIVAGSLMVAGVVAVGLTLLFDKSASNSAEVAKVTPKGAAQAAVEVAKAPIEPVDEKALAGRKASYRQGTFVLIGLAVLTALEFGVAKLLEGSVVFLFVLALVKAGVILQYYMHMNRAWGEEEAH
jgi:hypothetical protein